MEQMKLICFMLTHEIGDVIALVKVSILDEQKR